MKNTSTKASIKGNPTFGKGQPANYCGKAGRSGPPMDNRNNLRHGLKAGKLPKAARYVEHQLNRLRRELEDRVLALRGEVSLVDAAAIVSAIRWERHGALCNRWLRLEEENLKPLDRLQFSREVARASTERDRSIKLLRLDPASEANNAIDILYSDPPRIQSDAEKMPASASEEDQATNHTHTDTEAARAHPSEDRKK